MADRPFRAVSGHGQLLQKAATEVFEFHFVPAKKQKTLHHRSLLFALGSNSGLGRRAVYPLGFREIPGTAGESIQSPHPFSFWRPAFAEVHVGWFPPPAAF